jgi:hypothetical protein
MLNIGKEMFPLSDFTRKTSAVVEKFRIACGRAAQDPGAYQTLLTTPEQS